MRFVNENWQLEEGVVLPSPQQLRYKILIKAKKLSSKPRLQETPSSASFASAGSGSFGEFPSLLRTLRRIAIAVGAAGRHEHSAATL